MWVLLAAVAGAVVALLAAPYIPTGRSSAFRAPLHPQTTRAYATLLLVGGALAGAGFLWGQRTAPLRCASYGALADALTLAATATDSLTRELGRTYLLLETQRLAAPLMPWMRSRGP